MLGVIRRLACECHAFTRRPEPDASQVSGAKENHAASPAGHQKPTRTPDACQNDDDEGPISTMPTLTPEQRRRHGAVAAAPAADALGGRAALAPLMHPPQGAARRVLSAPLLSLPAVSDFCGNGGEARGGGAQGVVQASRIPDSLPVCPSPPAAAARGAGRGDAPGCGSCLGPCRPPAKRRRTRGGAGRRARGTPRRPSCHQ